LFKDSSLARQAAENLKLTANDLKEFNVVDSVINEPKGFDRFNMDKCTADIKREIRAALKRLTRVAPDKLVQKRHERYIEMRGL
jgi:acetyl-CoA carboxylase carboxyl transferase subunit alpha